MRSADIRGEMAVKEENKSEGHLRSRTFSDAKEQKMLQ